MKKIQTINDIECLKAANSVPIELIKQIERDFLEIYEAENIEVYLIEYRLPTWQALFVFEKGGDVLSILNDLIALEYIEKLKVEKLEYYRCAVRNEHDLQIYYSQMNIHDEKIEEWLVEKANW